MIGQSPIASLSAKPPKRERIKPNTRYDCGTRGELTVAEICAATGLGESTIYGRVMRGWRGERLLGAKENPGFPGRKSYPCGKAGTLTAQEIAKRAGVKLSTVYARVHDGWKGERLLLPPQPTHEPALPRTNAMAAACAVAFLAAKLKRLPNVKEIREVRPMSRQCAERWRAAMRHAMAA